MDRSQIKWTICLLLLIVGWAIPELSLSQNQDQPSEQKQGLKIESNAAGMVVSGPKSPPMASSMVDTNWQTGLGT